MEPSRSLTNITRTTPVPPMQDQHQREAQARPQVVAVADIEEVVRKLSEALSTTNTQLSISVDNAEKEVIVRVTDARTGKVIRQIPSEDILRMKRNVKAMIGLLYDHSV